MRVFIMGEDIQSGVYGASGGLVAEFGKERVRDCPLSENAFFGAAVGAAAVGTRPIVESAFCFSWVAMDSLVSQAAKMRYMFGGQVNLPIVYRLSSTMVGAWRRTIRTGLTPSSCTFQASRWCSPAMPMTPKGC